jgi:hypothetical protein
MLLAASALSPVSAQSAGSGEMSEGNAASSIGTLTCADIAGLSETDASAIIYYAAGYQDGLRDSDMEAEDGSADSSAAANASADAASPGAASQDAAANAPANAEGDNAAVGGVSATPDIPGSGGKMVGGLGLQANTIIGACSSSPDALISDTIADNGGSAGNPDAGGASSNTPGAASSGDAGSSAPADAGANAGGGAAVTPK